MKPTNEMIAAAWKAWHARHGGKLGPGPAFVEAIEAAFAAAPLIHAVQAMVDDHQTSEIHHPNHVLVPRDAFEILRKAMTS